MTPSKQLPVRPDIHPLSLVRMLWKRKLLVGIVWVLGSVLGAAIVYMLPAIYKSEASILVDSQKIPEKYVSSTVSSDVQDRIATINQEILSNSRLLTVMNQFNLYRSERKSLSQEELLDKMRANITFNLQRGWTGNKPGAFRVGFQGEDPNAVAQVANKLAQLYIDENILTRENQAQGTSQFMQQQLDQAKKTLDDLESRVSAYKMKHNGELPQQENAISGQLARLDSALQADRDAIRRAAETKLLLQSTLGAAESNYSALQAALKGSVGTADDNSPVTVAEAPAAPKPSEALQLRLDAARARYSEDHPDIKRLKDDLDQQLKIEAAQAAKAAKPHTGANGQTVARAVKPNPQAAKDLVDLNSARDRIASIKSQIAAADSEIAAREQDEQRLANNIGSNQGRLEKLPIREQDMAGLTRDYEIAKANYKMLLDKKYSAEMATDMEVRQKSERFTLLDSAPVPERPFKPNRPLLAGIATVIGLGLGLLIAFGIEFRQSTLLGEWELPKHIPVLGRVPYIEMTPASGNAGKPQTGVRADGRRRRVAALSSAGLSVLAIAGYFAWARF